MGREGEICLLLVDCIITFWFGLLGLLGLDCVCRVHVHVHSKLH
jgi:hypothetical protein